MILCKEELAKKIDSAIFPGSQGGPLEHIIAAKAVALGEAMRPEFKAYQQQILKNASALAKALMKGGFRPGQRRHGQPPDAGGPAPGPPHRQGDGRSAWTR